MMNSHWVPMLVAELIESGQIESLLQARLEVNANRMALAMPLLKGLRVESASSNLHLWLHLPSTWPAREFVSLLEPAGVLLIASDAFAVGDKSNAVRLCLGSVASDQDCLEGLRRIRRQLEMRRALVLPCS